MTDAKLAEEANVTLETAKAWLAGKTVGSMSAAKLQAVLLENRARLVKPAPTRTWSEPFRSPETQADVLRVLIDGPSTPAALARASGRSLNGVYSALKSMRAVGVVNHDSPLWSIADMVTAKRIIRCAERGAA